MANESICRECECAQGYRNRRTQEMVVVCNHYKAPNHAERLIKNSAPFGIPAFMEDCPKEILRKEMQNAH